MQRLLFSCLYLLGAVIALLFGMLIASQISTLMQAQTLMSFGHLFVMTLLSYWLYTHWALQNVTRINVTRCTKLTGVLFTLVFLTFSAVATLTWILMRKAGNYSDDQMFIAIYPFLVLMSASFGPGCLGLLITKT